MKQSYLNKISKIFIRPSHRNKVRFARNLYYVKTLSEELRLDTYVRMTGQVHTFINTVDPDKAKDLFLTGVPATLFSSIYLLRVNLAQVKFAKTRMAQLERDGDSGTYDYTGVKCLHDYRLNSCENIYLTKIEPVIMLFELTENTHENMDKLRHRVNI